jgi:hypothetical protein
MNPAVVGALARLRSLSAAQVRGVVTAVARIQPRLLVELAGRDDLDSDVREHLVREAPPYLVVELLEVWAPDPGLVRAAVETHGVLPDLVVWCGACGWIELACELAGQVEWTSARSVASRWSRVVDEEMPPSVRLALVDAALTERDPRPDFMSMPEWERREAMERLDQERTERAEVAWSLLERQPQLWVSLARNGEHAMQIRRILLKYPDELTDDVLLACIPEVVSEQLRDAEYLHGARLCGAAEYVQRWPRLRQVAAEELRGLVGEVVDGGWTPVDRYVGPEWEAIAALAELSDDVRLLTDTVAAIRTVEPSDYDTRDRQCLDEWRDGRANAVAALTTNSHVPRAELIALLPALDERALDAIHQHSEGELKSASAVQLARVRQAAEEQRPKLIEVPNDDELTEHDDPAAVLRTHLKYLKARAAQRDVTIDGLLRSRFTTPEILRALPAARVLDAADQADQVAELLAISCGDDQQCWSALPTLSDPPPARTITFGAWLDRLVPADPRPTK